MKNRIIELIKQPSTWTGIALILGALGINLNQDQISSLTAFGNALAGLILIISAKW